MEIPDEEFALHGTGSHHKYNTQGVASEKYELSDWQDG